MLNNPSMQITAKILLVLGICSIPTLAFPSGGIAEDKHEEFARRQILHNSPFVGLIRGVARDLLDRSWILCGKTNSCEFDVSCILRAGAKRKMVVKKGAFPATFYEKSLKTLDVPFVEQLVSQQAKKTVSIRFAVSGNLVFFQVIEPSSMGSVNNFVSKV